MRFTNIIRYQDYSYYYICDRNYELFKLKFKPKYILELLAEKSLTVLTRQQSSFYLSLLKNKEYKNLASVSLKFKRQLLKSEDTSTIRVSVIKLSAANLYCCLSVRQFLSLQIWTIRKFKNLNEIKTNK